VDCFKRDSNNILKEVNRLLQFSLLGWIIISIFWTSELLPPIKIGALILLILTATDIPLEKTFSSAGSISKKENPALFWGSIIVKTIVPFAILIKL